MTLLMLMFVFTLATFTLEFAPFSTLLSACFLLLLFNKLFLFFCIMRGWKRDTYFLEIIYFLRF